jgi:Tfp pilus assembly pilus retraction ATPase PilT
LIGEIRDQEAMESALAMAETGHLVLATLHTNNANRRWIESFTFSLLSGGNRFCSIFL